MDDFELDQDEPFSPVKVLIVGSLMLVFGLCLVSYPAYRMLMSSGSDSGAGTLENARTFTCTGCEPTQWKPGDDPPTAPVRPAPKGTGTEAAYVAPPIVASLSRRRRRRRRPPQLARPLSGAPPATATTAPATTTSPPATPAQSTPPRPPRPRPDPPRPARRPRPCLRPRRRPPSRSRDADSASFLDLLRDLLKGK